MSFCSLDFVVFFAIVLAAYWALPWKRARVWLLLAASFYFYARWNPWLALLICVSTTLDYFLARGIDSSRSPRLRKGLLAINIVANLGLLCYFKYVNFFLDSLRQALTLAGAEASLPVLEIILPVGISFYTFEAINYMVDVYRGHTRAEKNLANFLLFILFFPHLVAGPIVRARDFLPQIHRHKHFSWIRAQVGVQYLIMGAVKKLAIADRLAQFGDPVFANPGSFGTYAVWVGVLAYAVQIYCDFSGYTDMAIGCAHLLGYRLAINFNMPYLSQNVSEFWRRWHISLSSWLRDYLFIPLGGSRGSNRRTSLNLMITMTLGGLWHGASWPFVAWGVLHGLYLVVHRAFRAACQARPRLDALVQSWLATPFRWSLTLSCVLVGWVFFRAGAPGGSFGIAWTVLERMFVPSRGLGCPLHDSGLWYTVAVLVVCHAVGCFGLWPWIQKKVPAPVLGAGYATALLLALLLAPPTGKAFIYFQF
jgi:alginate O-acetyltransferase complex protein AlgI